MLDGKTQSVSFVKIKMKLFESSNFLGFIYRSCIFECLDQTKNGNVKLKVSLGPLGKPNGLEQANITIFVMLNID